MALSAADMQALTALGNVSGQLDWATLLGEFSPGTPAAGTASLGAETLAGGFTNPPFAGTGTLAAQQDLGRITPLPGADLMNNDIGRVLPIQQQGQQTLAAKQLEQSGDAMSGFMLDDNSLYKVPGSGEWGNGATDVMTLAQMRQGLADWLPDTTLQKLAPSDIATAYAQLKGSQQPIAIAGSGQATLGNQEAYAAAYGHAGAFGGDSGSGFTAPGLGTGGAPDETLASIKQKADIAAQQAATATAIIDLVGRYSGGPADAFKQQAVLHGLNAAGLSNAVDAISGKYGLPSFAAPQANPEARSLTTLMQQADGTNPGGAGATGGAWAGAPNYAPATPAATPSGLPYRTAQPGPVLDATQGADGAFTVNPADGGTTVFGGTHIHLPVNPAGGPANLSPTTQAYVNSLPAPNKINGPNWQQLDPDSKDFLLGAYNQAGYSNNDVTNAVAKGLPQFKAPAINPSTGGGGGVAASGQLVG